MPHKFAWFQEHLERCLWSPNFLEIQACHESGKNLKTADSLDPVTWWGALWSIQQKVRRCTRITLYWGFIGSIKDKNNKSKTWEDFIMWFNWGSYANKLCYLAQEAMKEFTSNTGLKVNTIKSAKTQHNKVCVVKGSTLEEIYKSLTKAAFGIFHELE